MGGRVACLGPVPKSPTTTNSFYHIVREKLNGIFRPRSTSTTIKSYINPRVTIITTSIFTPIIIIRTDITLLFFMKLFLYTMRRYW